MRPDPIDGAERSRHPTFALAVLAFVLVVAPNGCCRHADETGNIGEAQTIDLAQRVWTADNTPFVLLFGSPGAIPYERSGLLREAPRPGTGPVVWARRQVELRLPPAADTARAVILDLELAPGLQTQEIVALYAGSRAGRHRLRPGRQRCRIDLPLRTKADNRLLRLVFTKATARRPPHNRRLAARLHSLTLVQRKHPLLALPPQELLSLLHVETRPDGPVVHVGPVELRFALRLPSNAVLRFRPFLKLGSAPGRFNVGFQEDGGKQINLWSASVAPGEMAASVRVPLPGRAGKLVVVRLALTGSTAGVPAGGFERPRIDGSGPSRGLFEARARVQRDNARVAALRSALAKKNVLLVVLDAARARSFSCYGHARPTTPEIDRIALEGVVFDRAYSPAVITLLAMPSLWTSLYPDEHHAGVPHNDRLPDDKLSVVEILSAHGITTAGFVANTNAGAGMGLARGFTEFHPVHLEQKSWSAGAFDQVLPAWIDARKKNERFLLYVHFREPHFPYDPPAPFNTRFGPDAPLTVADRVQRDWRGALNSGVRQPSTAELDHLRRLYDGNLAYADEQVGVLRRRLEAAGLWDDTVVIVTADHGEGLFEHGWIGHNKQVYEESIRIPLVLRFPTHGAPRGKRVAALVDLVDLAPTLLDLFGLRARGGAGKRFRGSSLLPVVFGAAGKAATLSFSEGSRPTVAVVDERFKFIRSLDSGAEELYDLARDPQEAEDVRAGHAVRAAYYRQELHARLLRTGGPAPDARRRDKLTREQIESLKALGYLE